MPEPNTVEAELAALLSAGSHARAAEALVRGYGPEILGYLGALLRHDARADDAFSAFCEDVVRGIAGFRGECTLRTWAYKLAWHAVQRAVRDPHARRSRPLESADVERLAAEVRSTTALHLRDATKDALAEMRAGLSPEEQTLLVLRIDRELPWSEVAAVLAAEGDTQASEAALRKRFERLKTKLRDEAVARGLLARAR